MTLEDKLTEQLEDARKHAEKGEVCYMNFFLTSAKDHAAGIGKDISAKVAELETIGYTNGIPVELAYAREYAEERDVHGMNFSLILVNDYAAKIGKDMTAEVAEIRAIIEQ
ncbi:MAG: hypothetical protein NTV63_04190 [Candidatus Woesearchaeota archaeon]|nr:hypothetical protein [Candidatus Woesearchaeota archaeon]